MSTLAVDDHGAAALIPENDDVGLQDAPPCTRCSPMRSRPPDYRRYEDEEVADILVENDAVRE